MGNVLIIDDDQKIGAALSRVVSRLGHQATAVNTLAEGRRQADRGGYDIVFLDVRMPDGNGLDAIGDLQQTPSSPEIVVITGWGDPDGAELAMRRGAWDYIEKPPSLKTMSQTLSRALAYRESQASPTPWAFKWDGIPGENPKRIKCLHVAAKTAKSDANTLIIGETGTGKELLARAIHQNSQRAAHPFVVVDCASLPETIVESVLFGNVKGAFTGADRQRDGLILQAQDGTLFLDEIGELPLNVQKTFLRVLQERKVLPVGGSTERPCRFRLVAATNRDLDAMVETGQFRQDLLFRLRGTLIELPPLAEYKNDILLFANYYVRQFCERQGQSPKTFSEDFTAALLAYPWPGNIRELVNTLDGVVALAEESPVLYPVHLPIHIRVRVARSQVGERETDDASESIHTNTGRAITPTLDVTAQTATDLASTLPTLKTFRREQDTIYLKRLIDICQGDIKSALSFSGLSRSRLYALLKEHDMRLGSPEHEKEETA